MYCYECDDYVANDTAEGDIKQLRKQLTATEVHSHVVTTEPQLNHSLTRSGRVLRKTSISRDEVKAKYGMMRKRTTLRPLFDELEDPHGVCAAPGIPTRVLSWSR